ncbi:MAG: hypothetical protein R2831_09830 [Chitinophagaceae bacterium]
MISKTSNLFKVFLGSLMMLLASVSITNAQLYLNEFTGTGTCPTQGNVPTMATNATGAPLTRSNINCATVNNMFNSNGLNITNIIDNTKYIEFSVTANAGYKLNVASLQFFRQGSNTAPNSLEVRYSTDGFATSTSWGSAPLTTNPGGAPLLWDFTDFTTADGGTVTFRFYPYGATSVSGGVSATGGTFRLDDVTVNGTVIASGPYVLTSASTLSFPNTFVGSQSVEQSVNITGDNLVGAPGSITASVASTDFELSNDNVNWGYSTTLNFASATLTSTPLYVRFSPLASGSLTDIITFSGGGITTSPSIALDGTSITPSFPTQLAITSMVPSNPIINGAFDITVEAQGNLSNPQNVLANTDIVISVFTGTGLLGGVASGTMLAGTSSITFTGLTYNVAETGVVLQAERISGDVLTPAQTAPFNVVDVASQLVYVNLNTNAFVATNLATFQVQALRADNTLDVNYNDVVTISQTAGPGTIGGTLSVNAVNGIAQFNNIQFSSVGLVTMEATSTSLTPASANITVSNLPTITEIILPQYAINGSTSGARLQYVCRLQINNLIPNTSYKYSVGGSNNSALTTTAPGNFWAINNTANAFGHIVGQSSNKSFNGTLMDADEFVTTGRYAELTTDANGTYEGWFAFTPTGNAAFADGNQIHIYVQLNDGAVGTTIAHSLSTTNTVTMIAPNTSGRAVSGASAATNENMIFLYDNTSGSGRPIYGTWAENDGIVTNYTTWYGSTDGISGAWGAYIPTNLANGIQRIEQRDIQDGSILGCPAIDADGVWAVAGNTVNPSSGTTPIMFSITDAPLDPLPVAGTASGAATASVGSPVSYMLAGYTGNIQWQEAVNIGGPYADIAGQTSATLNYTPSTPGAYYIRAKVTSTSGYCEAFSNEVMTTATSSNATLLLTAFIQGYYAGTSTMQATLVNQGTSVNPTDCDSVTIELHQATSPYTMAETFTGVLQTNGTITCTYPALVIGNSYYVVIKHRNSIETWSANPVLMSATTIYNFSTSATQAYGSNTIDAGADGVYNIYNSDANQDGFIDIFDFLDWDTDNQNFASGNFVTDFNGDGFVDIFDFLVWDANNQNFVGINIP